MNIAQKLSQKRRQEQLAKAFPNGVRCQKCLEFGHWSYECTGKRTYVQRKSRTSQLKQKVEELQNKKGPTRASPDKKQKRAKVSSSEDSSSDSSDSDSSESSSNSSSSSSSSDSD